MSRRQQNQEGSLLGTVLKVGAVAAAGAAALAAVYYATTQTEEQQRETPSRPPRNSERRNRQIGRSRIRSGKWISSAGRVADLVDAFKANLILCGVCLEEITTSSSIWTCSECFTSSHLPCVSQWAHTSENPATKKWHCPTCRCNYDASIDLSYKCFCGRETNPPEIPGITPHACSDVCGRNQHCVLKCHPGPCVYQEEQSDR